MKNKKNNIVFTIVAADFFEVVRVFTTLHHRRILPSGSGRSHNDEDPIEKE